MEILRDSLVEYNLDSAKVESNAINFYNTDKNISTLFAKIKYLNEDDVSVYVKAADANKHSLELYVKKQNNEIVPKTGVVIGNDNEDAIFRFDLDSRFTNIVGTCKCRFLDTFVEDTIEKKATSDTFVYTVKENDIVDIIQEPPPDVIYSPTTGDLEIVGNGSFDTSTGNLEIGQEV